MRGVAREELSVRERGHVSATLGCRFVGFHKILGKLNRLTFIEIYVGLTSRSADTDTALGAHRLTLGRKIHDADFTRFNLVNFFNRAGDMSLCSALWHIKCVHALLGREKRLL